MRVHRDSSFCMSTQKREHLSNQEASQLINLRGSVDGQNPERQKGILAAELCLRFSDHLFEIVRKFMKVYHVYGDDGIYFWNMEYKR